MPDRIERGRPGKNSEVLPIPVFRILDAGGTTSFRKKIPEYVQGNQGLASNYPLASG